MNTIIIKASIDHTYSFANPILFNLTGTHIFRLCTYIFMCVTTCVSTHVHILLRPEVDVKLLPWFLSILNFSQDLPVTLGLIYSTILSSNKLQIIFLSPPSPH